MRRAVWISVGVAILLGAGGATYHFWPRKSQSTLGREEFEKTLKQLKATNANSPTKIFASKNWDEIDKNLKSTDGSVRAAILQSGIVFFDRGEDKEWTETELARLATMLLEQFDVAIKGKGERKAVTLNFHLLKRVLSRQVSATHSALFEKRLQHLNSEKSPYEFSLYVDLATHVRPLPKGTIAKLDSCVHSKDLGLAQSCLNMGEQIVDETQRAEWIRHLGGRYGQMRATLKPFAARILLTRPEISSARANEILQEASRSNNEVWQDVFLFGVERMGRTTEYRARVLELSKKAESPMMRQKAQLLLR